MSIFENSPQRRWTSLAVLIVLSALIRLAGTNFEKHLSGYGIKIKKLKTLKCSTCE